VNRQRWWSNFAEFPSHAGLRSYRHQDDQAYAALAGRAEPGFRGEIEPVRFSMVENEAGEVVALLNASGSMRGNRDDNGDRSRRSEMTADGGTLACSGQPRRSHDHARRW